VRLLPAIVMLVPTAAWGQSLLDRPPNVSGDWVVAAGTIQFNFTHRFTRSPAPERKVSNFPTFLVGAGLPWNTMVGFAYSTNSTLAPRYPNEWEFFVRHGFLNELEGAPFDLGAQVGYNLAADGLTGEVSVGKALGPVRLIGVSRLLSDPNSSGHADFVLGGGGLIKLSRFLSLGADWATITNKQAGQDEKNAWSAGLHVALPNTPHTLSLQATNTNAATLQGLSRGDSKTRYGFEFTIPLTLARYFSKSRPATAEAPTTPEPTVVEPRPSPEPSKEPPAAPADTAAKLDTAKAVPMDSVKPALPAPKAVAAEAPKPAAAPKTVHASMKGLAFLPKRVELVVGSALVWKNADPLVHTVTAVDKTFDSGLIQAGASWRHVFTRPGTYPVTCTLHPFMKATIVVKAEP